MINLQEIKNKEWSNMRTSLAKRIECVPGYNYPDVKRVTKSSLVVERGAIPVIFDVNTKELSVWNKCSRYSRGQVDLKDLNQLDVLIKEWCQETFDKYQDKE